MSVSAPGQGQEGLPAFPQSSPHFPTAPSQAQDGPQELSGLQGRGGALQVSPLPSLSLPSSWQPKFN